MISVGNKKTIYPDLHYSHLTNHQNAIPRCCEPSFEKFELYVSMICYKPFDLCFSICLFLCVNIPTLTLLSLFRAVMFWAAPVALAVGWVAYPGL